MKKTELINRWGAFACIVAMALYSFNGMFVRLAQTFADSHEDLSHGYFVPLFSIYVLWCERDRFLRAMGSASWTGAILSLFLMVIALFGTRGLQVRMEAAAFIGLCVTVPWALWGRKAAQICIFPALYLVFCIPLASFLDFVTIHLRLLASGTAVNVLNICGFDVIRQGTAIFSKRYAEFAIDIAEPCSGLRSLFAMMALTAAYAWMAHPTWLRRLILFAFSVPLAIFGNVVRILTICFIAACGDQEFALGFYHDYSGYVVFLTAISVMLAVSDLITRIARRKKKKVTEDVSAADCEKQPCILSLPIAQIATVGFFIAFTFMQATGSKPVLTAAPAVSLPEQIAGYTTDTVKFCQNGQCGILFYGEDLGDETACLRCGGELADITLGEKTLLPADTKITKRVYVAEDGTKFMVSMVVGGASKSSIHRPELCLPAQGFVMDHPRNVVVEDRPFHLITLRGEVDTVVAYTFFNQDGFITSSHTRRILKDMWDRSVLNQIDRWVMITVHVTPGPNVRDGALESSVHNFLKGVANL